jgi:uncharacterized protein (DUF983 family)
MTETDSQIRPIGPAMRRGARLRCPACGAAPLFSGFLSVRDICDVCGEALHHHRADDAPSWATILIVAHLMVPMILTARGFSGVPVWAHSLFWPVVALALCLLLLPRVKGAIIGYQWAQRMHGFAL